MSTASTSELRKRRTDNFIPVSAHPQKRRKVCETGPSCANDMDIGLLLFLDEGLELLGGILFPF
jgi:hypothetical protein